ncbi:DUF742 domain-containing protein [Streptomyces sp. URMC 123]|uniref:DUF742 domain-containing protein n=1 Tax=Streptomyces sp. URMC 123 TaxID=3423403 RepID=UPI003F1C3DCE
MGGEGERWFDDEAGPVVRPYAMTRGRTRGAAEERLDLIAVVVPGAAPGAGRPEGPPTADAGLAPEHLDIVALCEDMPRSVAELAAELDLPVGVVRVFIGDLVDGGWVRVTRPVPPAELPDESVLRDVISALRAL